MTEQVETRIMQLIQNIAKAEHELRWEAYFSINRRVQKAGIRTLKRELNLLVKSFK